MLSLVAKLKCLDDMLLPSLQKIVFWMFWLCCH